MFRLARATFDGLIASGAVRYSYIFQNFRGGVGAVQSLRFSTEIPFVFLQLSQAASDDSKFVAGALLLAQHNASFFQYRSEFAF